jgi:spore maturation protein CgeB
VVIGREEDAYPEANPERTAIARCTDLVLASSAGRYLEYYKRQGVPRCAFIPCPCDPDIHHPYPRDGRYQIDIFFAGKAGHGAGAADPDRETILARLSKMPNARIYGAFGVPRVEGIDCFIAMSNAKIALSINAVNDVSLYHSDRFFSSVSCGSFVLAKRVPDTELLFEDGKHLRYFDTPDQFFELAEYYLAHEDERQRIAAAGMARAQREFNCTVMAGHVLDILQKGTYDVPWARML